jgi:cytochrome c peroxidase
MPKHYSKFIFFIIGLIFASTFIYFKFTQPVFLAEQTAQLTVYTEQPVQGALQPLPLITEINQDWVRLGEALFNSTLLSSDNMVSCASCHIVSGGGDDGFPVSVGINSLTGTRNSPTVLNSALNFRQFWDGRNLSLSEQVSGPIHNPVEMGSNFPEIIKKLDSTPTFKKAFQQLDSNGITESSIVKALTTYEESLITHNSAIDRYLLGDDYALSPQQKRGLYKFTQYGCITCHQGRNIGGNLFQKLGRIDDVPPHLLQDKGRFNVTKLDKDLHVFKVPSLRNVALTAPYFHDGSIATLEESVQLMGKMQLGITLSDNDVKDIVALLNSFTGEVAEQGAK